MNIEIALTLLAVAIPLTALIIKFKSRPIPQNGNSPVTEKICQERHGNLEKAIIRVEGITEKIWAAMNK